jgi:hypothetical protein
VKGAATEINSFKMKSKKNSELDLGKDLQLSPALDFKSQSDANYLNDGH